ncbi:MAG: trigger factor, partial [Thermanaeromonas sp.]|uniref:trigger factor n=1 Tax=Thermanaeromonas sp. TaxID=2003697 RepID=UPI002439469F
FIADFEAQLVGAKVDEEREVKVTFPGNYFRQELAGKDAVFRVKIRAIKRKHLLPLDDEFAKDVSEFETLEELKADIRRRLEKEREEWAKAEIRRQAVEKVVEDAEVEVPKVLVERRIDRLIEDFAWQLRAQRSSLEKFMERTGKDISKLREDFRARAEKQVKTELVLEAVAKQEGLTATPEEIDKEIQEMARALNRDPAELKEKMGDGLERLKYDIIINKAAQFLADHSTPVVKDTKGEEAGENSGGEAEDVRPGTDSSGADQ